MKKQQSIFESLLILILVILFILFIPLFLIWIIITLPYSAYKQYKLQKKYKRFLLENEGKNFFCYNNRRLYHEYLQNEIIPLLDKNIDILNLDDKIILGNQTDFYRDLFYKYKKHKRFPHLFKIRKGRIVDKSVNDYLFKCMNNRKDFRNLIQKIEIFFELR